MAASSTSGVTKDEMAEFYRHVFPANSIVEWLSYGGTEAAFMTRREFCFTLIGDVFTRFRSYANVDTLRAELVRNTPEKIDIGAVYNVSPSMKQVMTITPTERELVFDIDMSDYDEVRQCCKGKTICSLCWGWMSVAATVIKHVVEKHLGFTCLLPVFSGRRGLHIWVCDKRARMLTDQERAAIVGYMSVVTSRSQVNVQAGRRFSGTTAIYHPLITELDLTLQRAFRRTFEMEHSVHDAALVNSNCIFVNAAAADVVIATLVSLEGRGGGKTRFGDALRRETSEGQPIARAKWEKTVKHLEKAETFSILIALRFALLYPRLDEKVTARRDHLLKLPFCIHPGTRKLCVPLDWGHIDTFNPVSDPPTLDELLQSRDIPRRWLEPMQGLLKTIAADLSIENGRPATKGRMKEEDRH